MTDYPLDLSVAERTSIKGISPALLASFGLHCLLILCALLLLRQPIVRHREVTMVPIMTLVQAPPVPKEPVKAIAKQPPAAQPVSTPPAEQQPVESADPAEPVTELPSQEPTAAAPTPASRVAPASSPGAGIGRPVRIGGAGMLDNTDFSPIVNIKPAYPAVALKANIEGYVDVDLVVDETGRVESFSLAKVSGHPSFGSETSKVVNRWRFPPPRMHGQKVKIQYLYRVHFTLD